MYKCLYCDNKSHHEKFCNVSCQKLYYKYIETYVPFPFITRCFIDIIDLDEINKEIDNFAKRQKTYSGLVKLNILENYDEEKIIVKINKIIEDNQDIYLREESLLEIVNQSFKTFKESVNIEEIRKNIFKDIVFNREKYPQEKYRIK